MARNEQLIRQHKILQILEDYRFGRTLEELRDEIVETLGLSSLHVRSVRRDLEALQAAGIDVGPAETGDRKAWKLGPKARTAVKIAASATELMALSLSRDLLYPLAGTPFWHGIETFWNKIKDAVPGSVWDHYERYRQALFVQGAAAKSYESHQGILSTINRAIFDHRIVEIEYHSIGKGPRKRRIEPYGVVFYQSSLYIVAAANEIPSGDSQRMRHWKLDRFQKADALDEWFKPEPGFDLEKHVRESLGIFAGGKPRAYKIRLSPTAARWVQEDPWRPDQSMETEADGAVILTVQAAHDQEVISRVLGLGADAEIIAPASCRKAMADIAYRMSQRYTKG